MTKKLYSVTDWDYHKGKLDWDDLVDEECRVVIIVAIMEIAKEEFLASDIVNEEVPTRIFLLGKDNIWTIYEDRDAFTCQDIQRILDELGKLTGIKYQFIPKPPPNWEEIVKKWEKEIDKAKQSRGE